MRILGSRLLVSRIEEEDTGGFKAVDVQDSFVYKGKIVEVGDIDTRYFGLKVGDTVLFAKYSPNTQEIPFDGQTMKIIALEDVMAVL